MKVGIKDLLPPSFYGLFWDLYEERHEEYWLLGGRGSGKSSFISVALLCLMLKNPKANVMIYRKVADTLRESVYAQMRWAAEQMGIESYFTWRLSPMSMIYRPTGQQVLFRGADDPEKSKGVKLSSGAFSALWFEEASAFRGMEEIRTIQASILRGGQGITILSYNPPVSVQNWANEEALKPVEGRLVHRSDYRQMPEEWLGQTFLRQARRLKEQDERAYRHMYLGEAVGSGGLVLPNVRMRAIAQEEWSEYTYAGLDFGFANDPDALVLCGYDRRKRILYLYKEHVRTDQSLRALAEACERLAPGKVIRCDSASPREIAELRRLRVNAISVKKGAGSVEHGLRWLKEQKEIVIDPNDCPVAAREFSTYEYAQDKTGAFLNECPDKNNHTIDAVRYALEALMTERVIRLKKGGIC
ncbi:MAG: PBSX family phage terminase large subunit [Eubacteriales bacterium]|nr:PBSX family phage terminase large subunit [Eubacteriales bacterium]